MAPDSSRSATGAPSRPPASSRLGSLLLESDNSVLHAGLLRSSLTDHLSSHSQFMFIPASSFLPGPLWLEASYFEVLPTNFWATRPPPDILGSVLQPSLSSTKAPKSFSRSHLPRHLSSLPFSLSFSLPGQAPSELPKASLGLISLDTFPLSPFLSLSLCHKPKPSVPASSPKHHLSLLSPSLSLSLCQERPPSRHLPSLLPSLFLPARPNSSKLPKASPFSTFPLFSSLPQTQAKHPQVPATTFPLPPSLSLSLCQAERPRARLRERQWWSRLHPELPVSPFSSRLRPGLAPDFGSVPASSRSLDFALTPGHAPHLCLGHSLLLTPRPRFSVVSASPTHGGHVAPGGSLHACMKGAMHAWEKLIDSGKLTKANLPPSSRYPATGLDSWRRA